MSMTFIKQSCALKLFCQNQNLGPGNQQLGQIRVQQRKQRTQIRFMKSAAAFTNRFFVFLQVFSEWREVEEFVHKNSGIRLPFVTRGAYKVSCIRSFCF